MAEPFSAGKAGSQEDLVFMVVIRSAWLFIKSLPQHSTKY